jgi:hypothetical protein
VFGANGANQAAGAIAFFKDAHLEAILREEVGGGQARETRADYVDGLH